MVGDMPGPDVIKIMLNSAEHVIVNAHKYKENQETQLFSDNPWKQFSCL